jgi:DNA-binding GntR family transcriptional regulator
MASMTLGERLRRGIENDILAGQLAPGDVIDERDLAQRYDVSRTPVREALLQLASLGLVTMSPRAPTRVTSLKPATLLQMSEVMCCLESEAARLAARRMQPAEREELRELQAQGARAVEAGDTAAFNEVNWKLHQAIFEGSHNAYLAEQARQLRLRLHPYRCYLLRIGRRLTDAHEQHESLVNAVIAGDPQAAGEQMRHHLALDKEQFADLLSLMPEPVDVLAET